MASNEDKTMMEEPAGQKRRLTSQASFDEDMDFDGFSELDKLDPVECGGAIQHQQQPPPQQQPTSSQPPSNQPASVPPPTAGNPLQNGTLVNGIAAPPPHASHGHQRQSTPQQQMHGQQGPSSVGQPPQQQQQSVLQELLQCTQSSASSMNNSPRQQQPAYSSSNFPNKSPMPPHSMAIPGPQNMSPMAMAAASQRSMGPQQMRQPPSIPPGHPGFDPSSISSSQAGQMPHGTFIQQQGAASMMANQQQQFAQYQQHPRPNIYGPNQAVRMPPQQGGPMSTQSGIRQPSGFAGNNIPPQSNSQNPTGRGGVRQAAPHQGVMMSVGGAPTPPIQGGRQMMMGGGQGVAQNNPAAGQFDPNHPSPFQQQMMAGGPMNGPTAGGGGGGGQPPQRQPSLSEANTYMMQGGQMMTAAHGHPQQMPSYMAPGQMAPHRPQIGFGQQGPPPQQMMPAGPMLESGMMGPGPSQQQAMGQMAPGGPNSQQQPGPMVNGTPQMMPGSGPRHPAVSNAQIQAQGGMMVQSPGLMNQGMGGGGPPNQQMRNPPPGPGSNGMGGGALGPQQMMGSQSQDPEKRKLIQQQLVLLLHAHKCQQRAKQEPQSLTQCTLPYCEVMKGVLAHMVTCHAGRQCQYPHCASSRQIITHWKNCTKEDCPVCNPVKKYTNQNQGGGPDNRRQGEMMLDASNLGALPPQAIIPTMPASQGQNSMALGGPNSIMFGSPPQQANIVTNLLDGFNPNPFRSTNPPNKVGQGPQSQMGQQQIGGFGTSNEGMPPPEPPSQPRDWHVSITPDLRNHLVGKLVKAIFPSPHPDAIHDQRIRDLISYARKVEKDMFEVAPDKEAYYHMLAEKIYKIQKELQEKKNKRELQQQMMEGGQPMMPQPPPNLRDVKLELIKQEVQSNNNQSQPAMMNFVESSIPAKRPKLEEPAMSNASTSSALESTAQLPTPQIKQEPSTANNSSSSLFPPAAAETRRSTTPKDAKPSTSTAQQEPIVKEPKIFDGNELRNHLLPIWQKLWDNEPESMPFRHPVDHVVMNIPDYPSIIKNPMDLETIKNNLDQGKYKNPWEFCDHMWQMFENAWLYNRKNTKIHKWCTRMSEVFVEEINPVMRQMGYCCGQKLNFTPLVQFCFGISKNNTACVIARDQPYFMYESSSTGFGVNVVDRYIYCVKCFEALPETGINMNENSAEPPNWIPKSMFQKLKNDQIDMEPFDNCKICDRKWHRICALHSPKNNPEGFICEMCRTEKSRPKPENKYTAKKLPHCQLSRFIEDRVNGFLHQKLTDGDPEVEVVIRVLCSSDKEVEVKPGMIKKYGPEGYPDRFPYRSKAIFAFEVMRDPDTGHSQEVCFFGLYVQEYGTSCAQPNQRRVYIAYLDSVHYFQPRNLRTLIYYEILLGYLQYAKKLGYTMAHIWACPPSEGDDYIFHCHPPEQKIPKPKRLQDWYKTMLNNGHEEGTVHSYKDIFNQAKDDGLDTPMKLPYFEGDYWPRIIDECIVSAEKEEEIDKRKQQEESSNISDDDTFQTDDGLPVKKQQKASSSKKKNNLKKSAANSKKKGGLSTGNPVVDRLFQQLEKHRDVFFTIKLFSPHEERIVMAQKPKIEDPDPLISCELMDTRDNFLGKSREEHWEYSQLRRSKWSTLNFCYTLHTQEQDKALPPYTCNMCEQPAQYHCTTCEDYDLCEACKAKNPHTHEMEKLLMEEQKSDDATAATRNDSVKRCINSLVHACTCRDANCRRGTCSKMKKVIQHTRSCKRRQAAGANCQVCKQLIALCCYHAKHCTFPKCQVPFCLQIRQKLQEQKRSQNRQAERMMQRRMMKLQAGTSMNGSGGAGMGPSTSQQHQQQHGQGSGGPSSIPQNWAQPPQSPVASMQSAQFAPQHVQQQMNPGSGTGMMISPSTYQQQMRINGPVGMHQNPMANQLINSPPMASVQQGAGGYGQMVVGGQPQQMQQVQMGMGQSGLQRIPSAGTMHPQQQMMSQQQQINPPPYRPGQGPPSQQQHQPGMSPLGFTGVPQQMGQNKFVPPQPSQRFQQPQQSGQRVVSMQPEQQQYGGMGQPQQQQMRPSDFTLILNKFKEARGPEEREVILTELKKTPHLFNAFLKMTAKRPGGELLSVSDMEIQQPQMRPPHHPQQQFMQPSGHYQQGNPGGAMMAQSQQNGAAPFNSPPPQHHQWMQQHQQQIPHPAQPPSQRNPT